MSDKEYKIEFFPKWLLWVFKIVPFIVVLFLLLAVTIDRNQPPQVREIIV